MTEEKTNRIPKHYKQHSWGWVPEQTMLPDGQVVTRWLWAQKDIYLAKLRRFCDLIATPQSKPATNGEPSSSTEPPSESMADTPE